jgi:hypothetical protein
MTLYRPGAIVTAQALFNAARKQLVRGCDLCASASKG